MNRDEIEIAVFGGIDPDSPSDSWRNQMLNALVSLARMDALDAETIQVVRDARSRMNGQVEQFIGLRTDL